MPPHPPVARPQATIDSAAPVRPSVTDTVHDSLFRDIMTAQLPPGHKLSEADLSRSLGVSRQPVRDALFRLSTRGLVIIRPQRATLVAPIAPESVDRARFIRAAIESECVRLACTSFSPAACDALEAVIAAQRVAIAAGDAAGFHQLDDRFHRMICEGAGKGYAWDVIHQMKAQMDRVRYLSIHFASSHACADHARILNAIRAGDAEAATAATRDHIGRITEQMQRLQALHPAHFAPPAPARGPAGDDGAAHAPAPDGTGGAPPA